MVAIFGLLVFLVGLLFVRSPGTIDVYYFLTWIATIYQNGVVEGYAKIASAQPPLYVPIFWLVANCAMWLSVPIFMMYKVSLFIAWLLTGLCLRLWTSNWAVIWVVLIALLPNAIALGYFDIYLAPLLFLSLWAAKTERWIGFSTAFTIFALVKGQALLLAPFAIVFAIATARHHRAAIATAAKLFIPGGLILVAVWLIFGTELVDSFGRATNDRFFSGKALNACWIITYGLRIWDPAQFGPLLADGSTELIETLPNFLPRVAMRVSFLVVYAGILISYWRRGVDFEDFIRYSFVGYLAYFVLNTGVHENHLIYGAYLSIALALTRRDYISYALVCCLAANINMLLFYGLTGKGLPFGHVVGIDLSVVFAIVNVLFFLVCCVELLAPSTAVRATAGPGGSPRQTAQRADFRNLVED